MPWMRSPSTHVPFLLPRSSIDTSRPVALSRAWWRETPCRIDDVSANAHGDRFLTRATEDAPGNCKSGDL